MRMQRTKRSSKEARHPKITHIDVSPFLTIVLFFSFLTFIYMAFVCYAMIHDEAAVVALVQEEDLLTVQRNVHLEEQCLAG